MRVDVVGHYHGMDAPSERATAGKRLLETATGDPPEGVAADDVNRLGPFDAPLV